LQEGWLAQSLFLLDIHLIPLRYAVNQGQDCLL
jgi:hypothetical protein